MENIFLKYDEENLYICIKCFDGYDLLGQECKKCKINGCLNCDGNVNIYQECKEEYKLDNVICIPFSINSHKYISIYA